MRKPIIVVIFVVLLICSSIVSAQSTELLYQGQLQTSNALANGTFDLEFALFGSPVGGSQIGSTLTRSGVNVVNGIFSVPLDFGNQFDGSPRFLEIRVRQSGGGAFTTLSPRQSLSSSPYAVRSLDSQTAVDAQSAANATTATTAINATNLTGPLAGDVTGTQGATTVARLQSRNVASTAPLNGQVLKYNSTTSRWEPDTDNVSGSGGNGTITGVTPGTGLTGGGATGNVTLGIANSGIGTTQLADLGVTDAKINSVSGVKVTGAVANATNAATAINFSGPLAGDVTGIQAATSIAANAVTTTKIADANVTNAKLANGSVTNAKIVDVVGSKITGAITTATISGANVTGAVANATTSTNFSGALAGDVTGTQTATTIANNAVTSPKIASGQVVKSINSLTDSVTLAAGSNITITPSGNTLTIASTGGAGTILNQTAVQTGANFSIDGNGTAGGTLSGGVVNATTQYNIGGIRQFTANGPLNSGPFNFTASNSFVGDRSGMNNVPSPTITSFSGKFNSFFGAGAGESNISGQNNAYFGTNAGRSASGSFNAYFGAEADVAGSGSRNVFVGYTAFSNGNENTAVGYAAGTSSSAATQLKTTAIGSSSRITGDIQFATAIGAGSNVDTSNTVVLGRTADTVQIPGGLNITGSLDIAGSLNVTGTFTPAITNGASILNLDAGNIATGLLSNARLGIVPIANGGTGSAIKNFVDLTTTQNIAGNKTFSGTLTGSIVNTTNQYNIDGNRVLSIAGVDNVFTGAGAGTANTGTGNSFFGRNAGAANITGNSNTVIGSGADLGSSNLTFATAIGAGAVTNSSDTVTLGRDVDIVRVPGILRVATLGAAGATALCQNGANAIATCSSSLRYKTNIGQFSQGMAFVNQLRPISFNWKEGAMRDVGFGAEDIAKIDPRFVTFNSKGEVEGVKYDRLSVAFVNAFKEQQTQIEVGRTENKKLKAEITELKAVVCSIRPKAKICRAAR